MYLYDNLISFTDEPRARSARAWISSRLSSFFCSCVGATRFAVEAVEDPIAVELAGTGGAGRLPVAGTERVSNGTDGVCKSSALAFALFSAAAATTAASAEVLFPAAVFINVARSSSIISCWKRIDSSLRFVKSRLFSSLLDADASTISLMVSESRLLIEDLSTSAGCCWFVVRENARDMISREIGIFFCVESSNHSTN